MTAPSASILKTIELADSGKFQEAAAQLSRHRDGRAAHLEPLFRMLARSFQSEAPSYAGWRSFLDNLAAANSAKVVFSSISDGVQPFDWRRVPLEVRTEAAGHVRADAASIALWTIGEGQAQASSPPTLRMGCHFAAHLISAFTSNVNDGFYLLLLREGEPLITVRFGANRVTVLVDGMEPLIVAAETRDTKLYSLVVGPDQLSLLVNGSMRANLPLSRRLSPDQVTLQLKGDPACDLGAFPAALEVWSGDAPMGDLLGPAESLVGLVVDEMLESGTASALYSLLRNMRALDLRQQQGRLLRLLDEMLQRRCYIPWIFDCFLDLVSESARDRWLEANQARLPKPVVAVDKLRIKFSRNPHRAMSLSRLLLRQADAAFNVLDEVDFSLFDGDILGIIGENGAGKSTLLRAVAGLVPISAGRIQVFGRHMLLSAGMGMRPEVTGRENIYLGGCFMGLTPREMSKLADEIIAFAELEEAIDRPFKFYSDGMKARLVFSLATSVSPDILMLDELLGAGDIRFQKKAAQRMHELITRSNLVIVVTHGLHFVREHCNKALYLSRGRQCFFGEPEEAIAHYLSDLHLNNAPTPNESHETALNQVIISQLNSGQQFSADIPA